MNNVCAVVVTYNRLEMLKKCISSLSCQTVPCDILVIDNASTDGTREYLDAEERVSCVHLEENTGGAGGFNAGMREAVQRGFTYVWVMDDDTLPFPDALEKLMEADQILKGKYGWLSSVALWKDGRECVMNRQKLLKAFYVDIHLMRYGLVRAEQATFVSLFLRSRIVRQYGLPIREFFIWGDDIEYTRRLCVRNKLPCYVAGQSRVTHAMKDNKGCSIALDSPDRLGRYSLTFRNGNYIRRQEGLPGFLFFVALCGVNFLQVLAKAKDHRLLRCWIILKQLVLGLFFNPKVEYMDGADHEE